MKRITIKGLADFMTASHARQRTILTHFKYPDEDEGQARIVYYREARDRVAALHRRGKDASWMLNQAASIDALASGSMGRARARLRHNSRALRAYATHFAKRQFEVLADVKLRLEYGDVLVSVMPDLYIAERGKKKVLKIEFGEKEPSSEMVKIIAQAFFEASQLAGLGLPASSVLFLDVARGKEHRGARLGSRMRREIEAAAKTISAIWDTI